MTKKKKVLKIILYPLCLLTPLPLLCFILFSLFVHECLSLYVYEFTHLISLQKYLLFILKRNNHVYQLLFIRLL